MVGLFPAQNQARMENFGLVFPGLKIDLQLTGKLS
jgi:hypothetical protein